MDTKKYIGLAILVAVLATTEGTVFNSPAKAECSQIGCPYQGQVTYDSFSVYDTLPAALTRRIGNIFHNITNRNNGCPTSNCQ